MLRKDQMQSKHTNLWEFWNLTSNAGFTPHACCLPEFCDELVPRGLAPFPWSCSFGFKQFQYASQAKNRNIQKTNNLTVPISVCIHAFSKRHMTTLAPGTRYSAQNVFPIFFKLFLSPSTLMLRCCESRSLAGGEFSCMNCKIYACCDEIDVTFGWIKQMFMEFLETKNSKSWKPECTDTPWSAFEVVPDEQAKAGRDFTYLIVDLVTWVNWTDLETLDILGLLD